MAFTHAAVLMGDIVDSETAHDTRHIHDRFNAAVDRQNALGNPALLSPLTITLGDEFQGLYSTLKHAVLAARTIAFDLAEDAIACRFVIGAVRIDTPVNQDNAWNMMGPGLSEARSTLNEKIPDLTYRISLPDAPQNVLLLDALGAGIAVIERSWTMRQRRDIRALLDGATPEDIARARNVTPRAVYKSRKGGEYDAYQRMWQAMLDALDAYDRRRT